jgi:hypothetical protein
MLISSPRVAFGFFLASVMSLFATCAMAQTTDSFQFVHDIGIPVPKIDPLLVEIDRRLQADRLQELNKLRLLTEMLEIRIEQAVSSEAILRQSEYRVRSGVGRGVDLEQASAYFSEVSVSWREAYLKRYIAVQLFRERYGALSSCDLYFEVYVQFSEKELVNSVELADMSLASQSWVRYRVTEELVSHSNMRMVSTRRVWAAYKQQFDIGQRTLLDFISAGREYADALVSLAETRAQYRLNKINLNLLTGRLSYIEDRAGIDGDCWVGLDEEIYLIERRISDLVQRISGVPLSLGYGLAGVLTPKGGSSIDDQKTPEEISMQSEEVVDGSVDYRRRVVKIQGKAMLRRVSGRMTRIVVGDYIPPNSEVIRWPNAKIIAKKDIARKNSLERPAAGLSGGEDGISRHKLNSSSCAGLINNQSFPMLQWPPWPPTDEHGLDLGARKSLGDVADYLSKALDQVGYANHYAFAAIPGSDSASIVGFAIIADPEKILPDGRAVPTDGRWQAKLPRAREVDLLSFIRGLVVAPEGRYRVMVFVVTDAPRNRSTTSLSDDSALRAFARCGPTQLNNATVEMRLLRARPVTAGTEIRVLVYEFTKQAEQQPVRFLKPGLSAQQHLEQAGIMTALVSRP